MKISHEVPLALLEESRNFNDYDYLLPHYYIKYPQYKEYYLKSRELGRFIIMDNGLFEGEVLSEKTLRQIIDEVKPNIFIAPDVWNDYSETYKHARYWKKLPLNNTKLMIVMQGSYYSEISTLYNDCLQLDIDHIAFNHSSKSYKIEAPHPNKNLSGMMGRVITINDIINEGDWNVHGYHHLLGLNLWQEIQLYKGYEYEAIKSIDTSNPIILGIKGVRYNEKFQDKPSEKIEIFMEEDLASKKEDIIFNIQTFRKYAF